MQKNGTCSLICGDNVAEMVRMPQREPEQKKAFVLPEQGARRQRKRHLFPVREKTMKRSFRFGEQEQGHRGYAKSVDIP